MGALIRFDRVLRSARSGARPKQPPSPEVPDDSDLLPIAVILWLASVVRVGYALWVREILGVESTLALACIVLIPWLLWSSLPVSRRRNRPYAGGPRAARQESANIVALASVRAERLRSTPRSTGDSA
jgi:hypothetical protein